MIAEEAFCNANMAIGFARGTLHQFVREGTPLPLMNEFLDLVEERRGALEVMQRCHGQRLAESSQSCAHCRGGETHNSTGRRQHRRLLASWPGALGRAFLPQYLLLRIHRQCAPQSGRTAACRARSDRPAAST